MEPQLLRDHGHSHTVTLDEDDLDYSGVECSCRPIRIASSRAEYARGAEILLRIAALEIDLKQAKIEERQFWQAQELHWERRKLEAKQRTVAEQVATMAKELRDDERACGVCQEEDRELCITPCGHVFCAPCLLRLRAPRKHGAVAFRPCPLCRQAVSFAASLGPVQLECEVVVAAGNSDAANDIGVAEGMFANEIGVVEALPR